MTALQTGHLGTFSPVLMGTPMSAPLCNVVLTVVNRHEPQKTWPQGVRVALLGGKKQIGHVYSDNGSGSGLVDSAVWVMRGRVGKIALLFPFPFPLPFVDGGRLKTCTISGSSTSEDSILHFDESVPGEMLVSLMIFMRLRLLTGLAEDL